ncbi:MAG: hypothetical protein IKH38_01300 [Clostridia bacterium]|nr:hypothetical protein [Clostridia bacterium]
MKKILSMLLIFSVLFGCSAALAEMDVQIISGPDMVTEPVSLDDIQLGIEVDIDGYATLLPTSFEFVDGLGAYKAGKREVHYNWDDCNQWYASGNDAEYAILRMEITNLNTRTKNFLENCEVRVVFDDLYEYAGWFYQYNYDNGTYDRHSFKNQQNRNYVINKADIFSINPMYTGHYCFGCTLPNAIVNSKKPLRMVITIDGNEITYNVRK